MASKENWEAQLQLYIDVYATKADNWNAVVDPTEVEMIAKVKHITG